MNIELREAQDEEKAVVTSLFNYYCYELSDVIDCKLDENGSYFNDPSLIDPYWNKADHIPYLIEVGNEIAGFVFVRNLPQEKNTKDIDQFYVLKKFKGLGVGSSAFKSCIEQHPGKWVVRVLEENEDALKFWSKTINACTSGKYEQQIELDRGLEMHFFRFNVCGQ